MVPKALEIPIHIQEEKENKRKEKEKDTMEMMDIGMKTTPKRHTGPKVVRKEKEKASQRTKARKEKMRRKEKEKVRLTQPNFLPTLTNLQLLMDRMPLIGETQTTTGTTDGPQIHGPDNHGKTTGTDTKRIMESGMTPQRLCPSHCLAVSKEKKSKY